jgi:membrane-associated protease RseP (regulator of RpoE activity)
VKDTPISYEPVVYEPPRPAEPRPQRTSVVGLVILGVAFLALAVFLPYWAIVVVALVFMIFLHELGHYATAKWSDMKVTEYFLFFGPKLWSFRKGETEYGIKTIPAGAYVKVLGMNNLEDVDPADEHRTYRQKSYPRRLAVGVAGSAMHFLLAFMCIFALLAFIGTPDGRLVQQRDRIENLTTIPDWVVSTVQADSAADRAGVEPEDRIVEIDRVPVASFDELRDEVESRPGDRVDLVVERDGEEVTLSAELGSQEDDGREEGFLGIGPGLPTVTYGPVAAAGHTFVEFGRIARLTGESLVQFFSPSGLADFFGDATGGGDEPAPGGGEGAAPEDSNRVLSILGALRIGAELTETGMAAFLQFFVMINIFIGIFNLIPLLPLDGGHVAIATYERLRSRKGRPYHADVAKMLPIAYAVVVLLVMVFVTALYLDIVDPLQLSN